MSLFDVAALLLGFSAGFGLVNHHVLRLPHTIGLVIMALGASLLIVLIEAVAPQVTIAEDIDRAIQGIDFYATVIQGMLSFLLFAGALHVDLDDLAAGKWVIGIMATVGVVLSTVVVGLIMWGVFNAAGISMPLLYAMVFGALISPTDPIAVLGILKRVAVPRSLRAKIAGESLFNDGVGVVVFTILVALAAGAHGHGAEIGPIGVIELFVFEAGGGAVLGLLFGTAAFFAMKSLDDYVLEVMVTLALVTVTYSVSDAVGVSGPIAVVVAGLLIGNQGTRFAMSPTTRDHVNKFWELLDEILNSVLFLLIGLEVLAIGLHAGHVAPALMAIPVVLLGRTAAVLIPVQALQRNRPFVPGTVPVLVWGGLRGAISVALALSLPDSEQKAAILAATYAVVIFSIVVQGLTVERVVRQTVRPREADRDPA